MNENEALKVQNAQLERQVQASEQLLARLSAELESKRLLAKYRPETVQVLKNGLFVPQVIYSEGLVERMIAEAAYSAGVRSEKVLRAREDVIRQHYRIVGLWECIAAVSAATGPGERLRAYLKSKLAHHTMIGLLRRLTKTLDDYRDKGIVLIVENDPLFAEFVTYVDHFAYLVDLVEQDRADGSDLISWLNEHAETQALSDRIRSRIETGGAPRKPELEDLYLVALPFRLGDARSWGTIAKGLWQYLDSRSVRSEREERVCQMWRGLSHAQRKEQIRQVFDPRGKS